jgi:formate--tetrahydrofolate ligase
MPAKPMGSDIEIARSAKMKPIEEVAASLGIPGEAVYRYGPHKAKLSFDFIRTLENRPRGKLILVTAISPTPAGEGKTTTTVGLGDALRHVGKKSLICLREPSLGPVFGAKGGAAGGGWAQVVPMDDINLHFTGDFHAIGAAHNLLSAMIDNHVYWGNQLDIDTRRVTWKRVLDCNDRALRNIVVGLGDGANGIPREDGFDITVASEVMAIFCLATSLADLQQRLAKIVIGRNRARQPVRAGDLEAQGAMTVLLKDALQPNLVQTIENTPAFIHGGPFANIAHGCNSVLATASALRLADYVVTEAGFGADLGAEKFFDIKCRKAGLEPAAAVVVATVRALKMHGGVPRDQLGKENVGAVEAGVVNLARHIENVQKFGVPVAVAINRFTSDTEAEFGAIVSACRKLGVTAHPCAHWAEGGAGAADLARDVVALAEAGKARFKPLYPDDMKLVDKIRTIATEIYRAKDIAIDAAAATRLMQIEDEGYGRLPICMAKTQFSFTTNPDLKGAPAGHTIPVREVRLSAGAEFVVALCGDIMTMPGLARIPNATKIGLDKDGLIEGLS